MVHPLHFDTFNTSIVRANNALHMMLCVNALKPVTLEVLFNGAQVVQQCLLNLMK